MIDTDADVVALDAFVFVSDESIGNREVEDTPAIHTVTLGDDEEVGLVDGEVLFCPPLQRLTGGERYALHGAFRFWEI